MASFQPLAFPRKIVWLARYLGWFRALGICAVKPFDILGRRFTESEWFWRLTESQFDRRHGVDTYEMVPVADLGIEGEREQDAVFYEPTPIMEFGYIISRLPVSYPDYAFVDMGSGKGRALLLGSAFPFKKIVGVEISQRLHDIAVTNLERYQGPRACRDISAVCDDAGAVELPSEPLVLFLFNPFEPPVLRAVLNNLHASLLENPRPVLLLYGSPIHREVFDNTPWLRPAGTELNGWYLKFEADESALRAAAIPPIAGNAGSAAEAHGTPAEPA